LLPPFFSDFSRFLCTKADGLKYSTNLPPIEDCNENLILSPNPANLELTIAIFKNQLLYENFSGIFMILDIDGNLKMNGNIEGELTLDISSLTNGFYQINVMSNSQFLYQETFLKNDGN
jgi:Secretion system C-terminal sorting domain